MPEHAFPPGPGLPGPAQAVLWGLRYPQFTQAAHARFGPTFRVRPGTMPAAGLTSDRDAIRRLFTGDPLKRGNSADVVRPLLSDRSIFLLGPSEHLARRKLLLRPFHSKRVRGYGALTQRLMSGEVARWRPGDTVRVLPLAQNITIEVILQAVLGVADRDLRERLRSLIDAVLFYPFGAGGLRLGSRVAPRFALPPWVREAAAFTVSLPTPAVMTYFPALKSRSPLNVGARRWWRHRDRLVALLDEQISASRADPVSPSARTCSRCWSKAEMKTGRPRAMRICVTTCSR